jgi:uncharacterized membrane protein YkgB
MADTKQIESTFDRIDRVITGFMADTGVTLLRISIGIVYIWFGLLKVIGISPAAPLIAESWDFVPFSMDLFTRLVGGLEVLIGLGFIFGIAMRLVIFLMLAQMLGAFSPLVLAPGRLFTAFPYGLTLEGQYVIKDIVFVSAALVIGATVRGGGLTEKPEVKAIDKALEDGDEVRIKPA